MALLQFELDHSLPLPWSYMCSQGKFLYLPVNTALQLPENWLHFSSTTLMLSTESALLLAARYPIYTVLHHLLYSVCVTFFPWETSPCQNVYAVVAEINFMYWSEFVSTSLEGPWQASLLAILLRKPWPSSCGVQGVGKWMRAWANELALKFKKENSIVVGWKMAK